MNCPNCGYCPHCGRSAQPVQHWPYGLTPHPWYPYVQPTWLTTGTITIGGNYQPTSTVSAEKAKINITYTE